MRLQILDAGANFVRFAVYRWKHDVRGDPRPAATKPHPDLEAFAMRSPYRLALAALLVFVALWVAACSKNDKSTNPPPGAELSSGQLAAGQVFQHTFATAGSFPYHCSNHPMMTGTVTVSASSVNDSAFVSMINSTATGFSPQSVNVKPGGHVRWLNNPGQPPHTVTSN